MKCSNAIRAYLRPIETDHEIVKKLISDHDKLWETMAKESQRVMEGAFAEKDKLIEEKEERIKMLLAKASEMEAVIHEPTPVARSAEEDNPGVVPDDVFPEKKSNGFKIPTFLRSTSKKKKQNPDDKAREREVLKYRDEFLISDKYDRG